MFFSPIAKSGSFLNALKPVAQALKTGAKAVGKVAAVYPQMPIDDTPLDEGVAPRAEIQGAGDELTKRERIRKALQGFGAAFEDDQPQQGGRAMNAPLEIAQVENPAFLWQRPYPQMKPSPIRQPFRQPLDGAYPRMLRKGGKVDENEMVIVGDGPNGEIIPGVTEAFQPDVAGKVIPANQLAPIADEFGNSAPVPQGAPMATPGVFPQLAPPTPMQVEKLIPTGEARPEGVYPTILTPKAEDDPDIYRRQRRLQTEGASKNSWGKRILQGALRGLANGGLGGAILGATVEGVSPTINGRFKTQQALADTNEAIKEREAIADAELNRKHKQTVIDNTIADNKARDKKDAETLANNRRNSFFRRYKNFDATKATPAQIKELAEFGETPETVGSFDFTKPNVQTIAGQKFLFNPNTRSFEDAGLPKDGSKAIVEYTVVDPTTGVESKYATTSERAAGFKTSLAAAGLQIQAAATRQTAGFAHDERMTRLRADITKSAADYAAKLKEIEAERDQTRKLALQQEGERLRQITLNLRKELDGVDQ